MDVGRARFMRRLRRAAADRVRIVYPEVAGRRRPGGPVNVHSKLLVVDDRLLCLGSANLAHRSLGLDTETCLAIEAAGPARRPSCARRSGGCATRCWPSTWRLAPEAVATAVAAAGGRLVPVLERADGRLRELRLRLPTWLRMVAAPARLADLDEPLTPEAGRRAPRNGAAAPRVARHLLRVGLLLALLVGLGVLAAERGARACASTSTPCSRSRTATRRARWAPSIVVLGAFVLGSLRPGADDPADRGDRGHDGPAGGFAYALLGSAAAAGTAFLIGRAARPRAGAAACRAPGRGA